MDKLFVRSEIQSETYRYSLSKFIGFYESLTTSSKYSIDAYEVVDKGFLVRYIFHSTYLDVPTRGAFKNFGIVLLNKRAQIDIISLKNDILHKVYHG